ncbi:MAG TPA: FAD-dependent oxidoreductase [Myxococcaceae bacterium]|nr:FAD-dependent oxidoreductase [Myxococcaceae bacterium]
MSVNTHIEPVLILGGGLAGLSTAFHLHRPWLLVEKESRVGGLVRTETMHGGFRFDPTGHWLHLRDPGMKALVHERLLPGGLVAVARRAAVFTRGVFTRFPYQVNTHGLPAEVVAENLLGFVEATAGEGGRALREREPANFEEFILRHLGAGFAKNFMVPYNTKLFGVPPRELSAAWCGRFVPKPTLKEVVDGALGLGSDALGYNATFVYPKEGGIEALARALHGALPAASPCEVRVGTEPLALDWERRATRLSDGSEVRWSALVSTLPLPLLVELLHLVPDEVRAAASKLRATDVTWVAVGVRGPNVQPWHWVYTPEPEFLTYRIGSPSAVFPGTAPAGTSSFYVEYSGPRPPQECARAAVEDLVRAKMIHRAADVLFAEPRVIRNAYVLYDAHYGQARQTVIDFLSRVGILTAGRYGNWEYSSMEDALLGGRAAAEQVERA